MPRMLLRGDFARVGGEWVRIDKWFEVRLDEGKRIGGRSVALSRDTADLEDGRPGKKARQNGKPSKGLPPSSRKERSLQLA